MSDYPNTASRMYIHRRNVVRFLIALLVALSALSFVSIALGWGKDAYIGSEDSGVPTALADTSPFYVLFIGSDSLEGTSLYMGGVNDGTDQADQHADSVTLARIDPETLTITLVTVPPNTVLYDSDEPLKDSLLEGGPIQTVYTVERIAGVDIRYYFMLDFSGFETVVNRVGKVNATVPEPIVIQDPVTAKTIRIKPGEDRKLDGAEALAFVRAWEPYASDVEAHRQQNARDVITDIIDQVMGFDDSKVRQILGAFEQNCATDMENGQLINLVTRFYENKDSVRVYSCTGPNLATSMGPTGEPIIRQPIAAWRELMTVVDSGQDPNEAVQPADPAPGEVPDGAPEDDFAAAGGQ